MMAGEAAGLVCDIGGTNARFAIARWGAGRPVLDHVMSLPGAPYTSVEGAARDYLARVAPGPLSGAVAACAGPILDRSVSFTNLAWATTEAAFGAAIGLPRVHLINDLAAVAWAAPVLGADSLRGVGPALAAPVGPATRAILNAGTGCNASALVAHEGGEAVVVGEYGHTSFAPVDAEEAKIWHRLHEQFGRVSIERVLSGPGLLNIYLAVCGIEGLAAACATPAEVGQAAERGEPVASRAASRFCAILGSVAGDIALCFGARAGVYLAGGVAASVLRPTDDAMFRERFADKGRFRPYLATIPTFLIRDGNAALLGAARALVAMNSSSWPSGLR